MTRFVQRTSAPRGWGAKSTSALLLLGTGLADSTPRQLHVTHLQADVSTGSRLRLSQSTHGYLTSETKTCILGPTPQNLTLIAAVLRHHSLDSSTIYHDIYSERCHSSGSQGGHVSLQTSDGSLLPLQLGAMRMLCRSHHALLSIPRIPAVSRLLVLCTAAQKYALAIVSLRQPNFGSGMLFYRPFCIN